MGLGIDEGFIGVMSAGPAPVLPDCGTRSGPSPALPPALALARCALRSHGQLTEAPPVYQQEPLPTPADAAAIRTRWREAGGGIRTSILSRIALHPEVAADDPWNFVFSRLPQRIGHLGLSRDEETAIWKWGQTLGLTKNLDPRDPLATLDLLKNLLTVRIDAAKRHARPTIDALSTLGVLPPFTTRMLARLEHDLGEKPIPSNVHFHYNGHLNPEILSLFVSLDVLGLENASISRSAQSGTPPIPKILESRLTNAPVFGTLERYRSWRTLPSIAPFPGIEDRTESILDRLRASVAKGEIFTIDKMSDLFRSGPLDDDVLDAMLEGKVRLVVHNRNDRDALDRLPEEIRKTVWGSDLSASRIKAFEADVIGEQYILEAARDVRERFGRRLIDTPVVVVGHGLLGGAITRALVRLGYPADQIHVRDTDPTAQAGALEQGFQAIDGADRLDDAVVFVATPGSGVNAGDLSAFARRSLVYSVTSGGRGIDLGSLRAADPAPETVNTRIGGHDFATGGTRTFDDLRFRLPGDGESIITAEGQQANLIRQAWWDRQNAVTGGAGGLNLALLVAARRTEPGIASPELDPDWRRWEDEALNAIRELDLHRIRPLPDPDPAERALLEQDLRQFPNAERYTSFTAAE